MKQLDLNGVWQLRCSDGQRGRNVYAECEVTDPVMYVDAEVPGEVHLDLMRAGWIADVYAGNNCLAARWVEECLWVYRKVFDAPAELCAAGAPPRAWLHFQCLDLAARIVLNGREIGTAANFFHPHRFEVTGQLRPTGNVLAVHLDAGLFHVADKPSAPYAFNVDQPLHKRQWLRKPQCQFGWDWSTRLINVGIQGDVRLEWTDQPVRVEQLVPWVEVSDDLSRGRVRARLMVEGLVSDATPARLRVSLADAPGAAPVGVAEADILVKSGLHPYEVELTLDHPRLWWPVGYGAPERYVLNATLHVGAVEAGRRQTAIGFRRVVVNQDVHPTGHGRYFVLEINHRKVFVKGANFVPADMIYATLDRRRYETLVERALELNFNMLRVWGGGLYESDDFYELCDARGILVWQEFIFACSRYPSTDGAFNQSVQTEARYQIRRLASHPSLVIWCGNNENEQGNWHWGFDRNHVLPDYGLFHLTLPRLLREEDPTRYYQPSSPYSPPGIDPTADHVGDQHPWSIGFGDTDFRKYRDMICRFPNEGGILGPTSLPTMRRCLPEGQSQPWSLAWRVHDNGVATWHEPSATDAMLQQWIGRDVRRMDLAEFAYFGGLVQGEGLREYCENFRRRMFDSAAAIFWMYNDCWPAVRSWTVVDHALRRTPAFWAVRRAMQPIHVVLSADDVAVRIHGINETESPVTGELSYGLFALAGDRPVELQRSVTLPPRAATVVAEFPRQAWTDPTRTLAFATLRRNHRLLARNRLILPFYRELCWPEARVQVDVRPGTATFRSPTFAWGVCLDLDGDQALADNLFDLYPGESHEIPWNSPVPPVIQYVGNLC